MSSKDEHNLGLVSKITFLDFLPPAPHQFRVCHVMMKPKFLQLILTWENLLMFNVCDVSHSVQLYFVYKKTIAVPRFLIKTFHL